jgi:acetyl-CoA carboxylase biotin carboxylase subunit
MKSITKILIANRGEIAIRVMRTANQMGIATVVVYSDADKEALFVKKADEAICIGGTHASESYLVQDKIIAAAKQTGANAIHPGYGFLSENASFSKRCKDEGIIFIGPSAEAITAMGSKIGAKEIMSKAGVPVVPGYHGADQSAATLKKEAKRVGLPVLLKASAGGGGKGMRIVNKIEELEDAIEGASREAQKSFGDGSLLIEKYFPSAKHIEFQIFGDEHGTHTHFFERECSLQRRYQKVIEESPSPSITNLQRKQMGDAAVAAAKSINYTGAGTVEFILDSKGNFYFLEVNTRLQVEHPVTEETTGLDLVRMQIEVAQGLPLSATAETVTQHGHSIECRVCAEDPENNFFPATGNILYWSEPQIQGLRYDSGVQSGSKVDVFYDSMIAKVISYGQNRTEAIQKMLYALSNMPVLGITTNKDFLKQLLTHPAYIDGSFDTKLIEREFGGYKKEVGDEALHQAAIAALLYGWYNRSKTQVYSKSLNGWRNIPYQGQIYNVDYGGVQIQMEYWLEGVATLRIKILGVIEVTAQLIDVGINTISVTIDNHLLKFVIAINAGEIFVHHPQAGALKLKEVPRFVLPGSTIAKGDYIAPMPGEIVKVLVKPGDMVKSGKGLLVMSSMKMETTIEAHTDGEVQEVFVAEKSFVEANSVLLKVKEN